MHWLDIALLIPLLLAAWRGFRRGLILELATLVGLGLGIYAGIKFSHFAADILAENLSIESSHLPILSFAFTFLAVVIGVFILGKILERIVKIMALSIFNKLAGVLFSVSKVAIIMSILLVVFSRFNSDFEWIQKESLNKSLSYQYLLGIGDFILPQFEEVMQEQEINL